MTDLAAGTRLESWDSRLPTLIRDNPPSGFRYEDLEAYNYKIPLAIMLGQFQVYLTLETLGGDAVNWVDQMNRGFRKDDLFEKIPRVLDALIHERLENDTCLARQGYTALTKAPIRYSQLKFTCERERYMLHIEEMDGTCLLWPYLN